ncbi:hypothetical protein JD969_07990 [Planctomycetota bacterium]|nr:hypothetical protein JD969_07990 [Planctomycetota bacterium]
MCELSMEGGARWIWRGLEGGRGLVVGVEGMGGGEEGVGDGWRGCWGGGELRCWEGRLLHDEQ